MVKQFLIKRVLGKLGCADFEEMEGLVVKV
jgi:hypothetical protein